MNSIARVMGIFAMEIHRDLRSFARPTHVNRLIFPNRERKVYRDCIYVLHGPGGGSVNCRFPFTPNVRYRFSETWPATKRAYVIHIEDDIYLFGAVYKGVLYLKFGNSFRRFPNGCTHLRVIPFSNHCKD